MNEQEFNIVVNILCFVGYGYLASRQIFEIRRLRNRITPIRWLIFAVFMIAIVTIIPVVMYQFSVLESHPSDLLRVFSTILSPINRLATLTLIIVIVHYQIKAEDA